MVQQSQNRHTASPQINTSPQPGQSSQKQASLLPPLPVIRGLVSNDSITARRRRRMPSVQDMYNSWRALEEQVEKIPRLPMFIKTESKFCHECRILKRRCECFDLVQLEASFQEANAALKERALHQVPFPSRRSQTPVASTAPKQKQKQKQIAKPKKTAKSEDALALGILDIKTEDFDFNNMAVPEPVSQTSKASVKANAKTTFERQTVVLAREKIGANARRWQCQFGSGTGSKSAGPVCTREDDNMETIRRHYGREHGRHRYYKKPSIQVRCSKCNYQLSTTASGSSSSQPPAACPSCATAHSIWLREMTAVIEVPVETVAAADLSVKSFDPAEPAPTAYLQPVSAALTPLTPLSPSPLTPGTPFSPFPAFSSSFSSFSSMPAYPSFTPAPAFHPTPSAVASVPSYSPLVSFSPNTSNGSALFDADMAGLFSFNSSSAPVSYSAIDPVILGIDMGVDMGIDMGQNTTAAETPYIEVQAPADELYVQQPQPYLDQPVTSADGLQIMGMDFFGGL